MRALQFARRRPAIDGTSSQKPFGAFLGVVALAFRGRTVGRNLSTLAQGRPRRKYHKGSADNSLAANRSHRLRTEKGIKGD